MSRSGSHIRPQRMDSPRAVQAGVSSDAVVGERAALPVSLCAERAAAGFAELALWKASVTGAAPGLRSVVALASEHTPAHEGRLRDHRAGRARAAGVAPAVVATGAQATTEDAEQAAVTDADAVSAARTDESPRRACAARGRRPQPVHHAAFAVACSHSASRGRTRERSARTTTSPERDQGPSRRGSVASARLARPRRARRRGGGRPTRRRQWATRCPGTNCSR